MEFNDDIWNEIKEFLFHRHLWNIPKHKLFRNVIKNLPKIGNCSPTVFNYVPKSVVHTSNERDKFVKMYEIINWNSHLIKIVIYLFLPKSDDYEKFLLESMKYDVL